MDSKVEEFLRLEKQSNTDLAHKCVAKKFDLWFAEYSVHKKKSEKLVTSRKQMKAFRAWNYEQPPHQVPSELIDDNFFARFLMHCLLKLNMKKSSLRQVHG